LVLPYEETAPHFATVPSLCGAGCSVLGRVQIGARSALGSGCVIRADGHFVRIGDDFQLGECSTVHIAHEVYPTIIGDRVTVGRDAVVHACTVGSHCVIEDDVVILDGSVIQDNVLIDVGSTVFPRSALIAGRVYAGNPAKPIRDLTRHEFLEREARLRTAILSSAISTSYNTPSMEDRFRDDIFVAQTASLTGSIEVGPRASVYFGCHLDAREAKITIGENSDIQDNTRIRCDVNEVTIGRRTTIGRNVQLTSCCIGERTLVGIGSFVSARTVIEDDVLLAAGSSTEAGQHLEGGWVWGGRPARRMSKLNDTKRLMMREIIDIYYAYGQAFRRATST
jgi:carbonic anhydrase/acetyltransferase-like protein (isoleucine patch superfamily)